MQVVVPKFGSAFALMLVLTGCGTDSSSSEPDATPEVDAHICTQVYFYEGLSVRFDADHILGWPQGTYRLELDADGELVTLEGAVTDSRISCAGGINDCTVTRELTDGRTLKVFFEVSSVSGLVHVYYQRGTEPAGGPAKADMELFLDDASIGSGSYKPVYTVDEPNGAGCGVSTRARGDDIVIDTTP